jgi:hypothetical protein
VPEKLSLTDEREHPATKLDGFLVQYCNTRCNTGRPGIKFPVLPERGNCAGLQPYLSIAAMPNLQSSISNHNDQSTNNYKTIQLFFPMEVFIC